MKKILKLIDVLIVLSFLLVASVAASVSAADIKTLVVAIDGDIETLDTNGSHFPTSNLCNLNVYDQLFRYGIDDTGKGYSVTNVTKIEGAAIESWEIADDNLSVVLHVRKGMTFPKTGNPVTADDIMFWYERGIDSQGGHKYVIQSTGISNFTKLGEYEVLVEFSRPLYPATFYGYFRGQSQGVTDSVEVMKHATEDDPWGAKWLAKNYAGSGEYMVESWEPENQMVLKANENYWGGKPYFDRIILKVIPNSSLRALLLKKGEIDVAFGLSADQVDALSDEDSVQIMRIPSRTHVDVILNNSKPPFNNKKIRQALAYLVPYEAIINNVYNGRAIPAKSEIPVLGLNYNPEFWKYETNIDKAKELLAEAGVPDGFEFNLNIKQGEEISHILAVTLQTEFKKAGVMMNIREVTNAAFASEMSTAIHEATLWGVGRLSYIDDPLVIMESLRCNSTINRPSYCNPRVDKIADEFFVTYDPADRQKLADEFQSILADDMPELLLANIPIEYLLNSNLEGFVFMQDSLVWFHSLRRRSE